MRERPRPEYDPLGLRAGAFRILPYIDVTESYTDNVYATDDDEVDDFITVLSPNVTVSSDWSRHALFLDAGADIGLYASESDENYEDFRTRLGGRLDIMADSNVTGAIGYSREHEDRANPLDPIRGGTEPTTFETFFADAAFNKRFNRLSFTLGGDWRTIDYDDTDDAGGAEIDNDDRDRDEYSARLRVGYAISPGYSAFVEGAAFFERYDQDVDAAGFQRDSEGYRVVGGLAMDLTGLLFGEIFAGYLTRSYDDPRFGDTSSPALGAGLTWNVTELTTLTVDADTYIEEFIGSDVSGYVVYRLAVGADHELLRNLIVGGRLAFERNDFEGTPREDDIYEGALLADYFLNRYMRVGGALRHTTRDSDIPTEEYSENVVSVTLRLQM